MANKESKVNDLWSKKCFFANTGGIFGGGLKAQYRASGLCLVSPLICECEAGNQWTESLTRLSIQDKLTWERGPDRSWSF